MSKIIIQYDHTKIKKKKAYSVNSNNNTDSNINNSQGELNSRTTHEIRLQSHISKVFMMQITTI